MSNRGFWFDVWLIGFLNAASCYVGLKVILGHEWTVRTFLASIIIIGSGAITSIYFDARRKRGKL